MAKRLIKQSSGFHRIACSEPCHLELALGSRDGVLWNLSGVGLYVVLQPPLPEVGEKLRVRFSLPGDPAPIMAQACVVWQNPPFLRGSGQMAPTLPPGCGMRFLTLDAADRARIELRVRATYPERFERPR